MKRKLIVFLMSIFMVTLVACSNKSDVNENIEENVLEKSEEVNVNEETIISTEKEDVLESEVLSEDNEELKEENNSPSQEINDELIKEKYNQVKELLLNAKMTVTEKDENELEADNGIGEKIVYKIDDLGKIELTYNVKKTSIYNDGEYNIYGTILQNIISVVNPNEELTDEINMSIKEYLSQEDKLEDYKISVDGTDIIISEEYDMIIISLKL